VQPFCPVMRADLYETKLYAAHAPAFIQG
jgi:hypothetical protein